MGIPHVNTVLDKSQLHGAPRFVLTVIAHHRNAGGYAWPSVRTLAHETGYSKTHVLNSSRRYSSPVSYTAGRRQAQAGAISIASAEHWVVTLRLPRVVTTG